MVEVQLNKKQSNQFYGLKNCLLLYQQASKGQVTDSQLNQCWNEVKNIKEHREMFFSILFSIGDITARQHNAFGKDKIDSGGNSQREAFSSILNWIKNNVYMQYRNFLFQNLITEFTSFDTLLANRVVTKKGKQKVEKVIDNLSGSREYLDDLSTYCANITLGNNPTQKYFLAKFLTRPRLSKRSGHKKMLKETHSLMKQREFFLKLVSRKAGLSYIKRDTHIEFKGYTDWRKEYNGTLESVLFSSKKVLEFDEQQFLEWLGKLPSSARFRVRCRLLDKDNKPKVVKSVAVDVETAGLDGSVVPAVMPEETTKWSQLASWFLKWENYKEEKQKEVRVVEEKIKQGTATEEEKSTIEKVKKEAKVTVGSINFEQLFGEIVMGTVDKLKIQPFLDKINLPYNTLTFLDDSSSMLMSRGKYGFSAFDFANFIATICLMKNPHDSGRSLLGYFSNDCRVVSTMSYRTRTVNSILNAQVSNISTEPLYIPEQSFLENLKRIREFSNAIRTSNGTDISSIPRNLKNWTDMSPNNLETLMEFPVWTIVTDGNWNQLSSPEASMNDFMAKCQSYFGFKPFVIAIDVAGESSARIDRFQGIENFMYIAPNPAQIEQFLTNFNDIDVMDVYTPLQSIYRSTRYALVRNAVL